MMSADGFIASQKRRRAEVCAEIERLTIENDGVLPKKATTRLRQEKDALDRAIYHASRKGIVECT